MRRWTSTISAILLALVLWSGALGHAAAPADHHHHDAASIAISPDAAPGSQRGGSETNAVYHHHAGDPGHQLAALSEVNLLLSRSDVGAPRFGRQAGWLAGDSPPLPLRPPIA